MQGAGTLLAGTGIKAKFTFRETGFCNHNDAWLLRPSSIRTELRRWLDKALRQ